MEGMFCGLACGLSLECLMYFGKECVICFWVMKNSIYQLNTSLPFPTSKTV